MFYPIPPEDWICSFCQGRRQLLRRADMLRVLACARCEQNRIADFFDRVHVTAVLTLNPDDLAFLRTCGIATPSFEQQARKTW